MSCKHILSFTVWMIAVLLLMGSNGCKGPVSEKEKSTIALKKPSLGSRFGAFVATLESLPVTERALPVEQFISEHPQTPVIEHDSIFSLYWYGKAVSVKVNGDLQQGWSSPDPLARIDCGDSAFFHKAYIVLSGCRQV